MEKLTNGVGGILTALVYFCSEAVHRQPETCSRKKLTDQITRLSGLGFNVYLALAGSGPFSGDEIVKGLIWIFVAVCILRTASAIEIVAHRGAAATAPENTLSAFRLAWAEGADACEMDLRLSADGKIVVIHDQDTRRTTGAFKVVASTTLTDLRKLDAGSWKGAAYKNERIPTLAEALEILPEGKRFFLEIKCGAEIFPHLAKQLEAWKARASQISIITFDPIIARRCKAELPWFKVYRLSSGTDSQRKRVTIDQLIAEAKKDGLDGLHLSVGLPWAQFPRVRAAGLELYIWTVNDLGDVGYFSSTGINGITTDRPTAARSAL